MFKIFNQPEVGTGAGAATETSTPETTSAAPAAETKAPAKKTAKKAASGKKAAKAAKKAAPKKAASNGSVGRAKKDGLRNPQIRVLQALSKHGQLGRAGIAAKAKVDNAALTEYIGSLDEEVRKANDAKHFPSLLGLKYVRTVAGQDGDKEVTEFEITASGKAAMEKALKAQSEK